VLRRKFASFRTTDYRWRELFESADVMSEGAVRKEREGSMYYGTTSVLLPYVSHGGHLPDELGLLVGRLLSCDMHARVRAIRIACREAQVRSPLPLGRVNAELVVRPDTRGLRIDVEVEAPVKTASNTRGTSRRGVYVVGRRRAGHG
jgi:hypothetical protein